MNGRPAVALAAKTSPPVCGPPGKSWSVGLLSSESDAGNIGARRTLVNEALRVDGETFTIERLRITDGRRAIGS
jgi:hypothetical protein